MVSTVDSFITAFVTTAESFILCKTLVWYVHNCFSVQNMYNSKFSLAITPKCLGTNVVVFKRVWSSVCNLSFTTKTNRENILISLKSDVI